MGTEKNNVLVVDDIQENCDILQHRLSKVGYNVQTMTDSTEVVDTLQAGDFGLVLLDINMPGKSGITLLEEIRSDDNLADTAVIMITAVDDMQVALDCMRKGACGYLTKPFNIDQIRQQINNCFKQGKE